MQCECGKEIVVNKLHPHRLTRYVCTNKINVHLCYKSYMVHVINGDLSGFKLNKIWFIGSYLGSNNSVTFQYIDKNTVLTKDGLIVDILDLNSDLLESNVIKSERLSKAAAFMGLSTDIEKYKEYSKQNKRILTACKIANGCLD